MERSCPEGPEIEKLRDLAIVGAVHATERRRVDITAIERTGLEVVGQFEIGGHS